jgi:hypothetical protein
MVQGFVLERTDCGAAAVTHWGRGTPVKSLWREIKIPAEGVIPIGSFRCASCGYLESYARDEFAAQ